jgi:hypothetical protein
MFVCVCVCVCVCRRQYVGQPRMHNIPIVLSVTTPNTGHVGKFQAHRSSKLHVLSSKLLVSTIETEEGTFPTVCSWSLYILHSSEQKLRYRT